MFGSKNPTVDNQYGSCATCYYWQNPQCRRNAPSAAFSVQLRGADRDVDWEAFWPHTRPSAWCGEYRQDPKKPARR